MLRDFNIRIRAQKGASDLLRKVVIKFSWGKYSLLFVRKNQVFGRVFVITLIAILEFCVGS